MMLCQREKVERIAHPQGESPEIFPLIPMRAFDWQLRWSERLMTLTLAQPAHR
jgi:hypothetical protein